MLTKRIIPCLDVKQGRVVKGVNFVDLIDAGDPVEAARAYDAAGADELVFLDITASHEAREIMVDVVRRTADCVFMPMTIGGGLRTVGDIRAMLLAGADKVSLNTSAVQNREFIKEASERFGAQCIVVAIDARRRAKDEERRTKDEKGEEGVGVGVGERADSSNWEVYTHGGRKPTGLDVIEWARRVVELGAGEILLTSMDCDGTQNGYDLELTAAVSEAVGVPVIASGGVGTLEHLYEGLTIGKADAVLAASIFHFGKYSIGEAKEYLKHRGVPVRN